MTEFELIRRYFTRPAPHALLGIGDDAALLDVSSDSVLAVSTDMLVSGVHFLADTDAYLVGHKALAVNLSDMAAMGAKPRWTTLAIALPRADDRWLERFSTGFFSLADLYGVELVGGDSTRGPLNLCVTIFGELPQRQALRRDGARVGDDIWVSGTLGDAALALAHLQSHASLSPQEFSACAPALHQPQPRVALGIALRGVANSAIDVSDGLLSDLGHILAASNLGATVDYTLVPVSSVLRAYSERPLGRHCALSGGDDYELCFTAPAMRRTEILGIQERLGLPLSRIGKITGGRGCIVHDGAGGLLDVESAGYDHFQ